MKFNLVNYNLEALNLSDKEHYHVVYRFSHDPKVIRFISPDFENFVKEPDVKEMITDNATYVIRKNDDEDIIGLVGSKALDEHGELELWMALNPSDCGHGNGSRILAEITPYLIENIKGLNDIKIKIDKNNLPSKRNPIKVGYNYISTDSDGIETYKYFEERKEKGR